jgi:tetratricopeptide (TPR) repeat protein
MFKFYLTALLLIGSSSVALADARQDCDNLSGDASIQACDQAIRQNPRDAVSYYNRGVGYFHKGDFDRATADFSESIEINPKSPMAYNARGVIFEERGDFGRAIVDANKAIEIDPKYAPAYSNRGNALMRKGGDLDRAIADYAKSIEIDPLQNNGAHLNAYYNRGFAYQLKHDLDRAMADYAKAIEVDPKHALAHIGRGFLFRVRGDLDSAIADYTKAIEIDSTHALPYIRRAEAYRDKGDVDSALADYAKVIEMDPLPKEDAHAYYNRGIAYEGKSDFNRAIADFTKAIEIDPKFAIAYNSRCGLRARANLDLPLALSDCDDAVRLAPNNASMVGSRGFVYLRLDRLDEAIADYDAALKINPKQVGALYGRGLAKRKKGDQVGGDADIAAAKAIKTTIADEFAKYGVD